jgi:hypothetical protein
MDGRRLLPSALVELSLTDFQNAQTMRRKQDGIPHNRTSPGRNTGAVSGNRCRERTLSSDRAKTARSLVRAPRQQVHRREEEALREERMPQPRHGVSVPIDAVVLRAEKPQTEKRGLRYLLRGFPRRSAQLHEGSMDSGRSRSGPGSGSCSVGMVGWTGPASGEKREYRCLKQCTLQGPRYGSRGRACRIGAPIAWSRKSVAVRPSARRKDRLKVLTLANPEPAAMRYTGRSVSSSNLFARSKRQ